MTAPAASQRARMAALVWTFEHLDDGLTVEGLAGVLLGLDEAFVPVASRGACPEALAHELRLGDAAAALNGLEAEGLLYRRRDGGRQLTDTGLVMARAAVGSFRAAWAQVVLKGTGHQPPVGLMGDRSGLTAHDDGGPDDPPA